MLVIHPTNAKDQNIKSLHEVKPGKLVELKAPSGDVSIYLMCKSTEIENLNLPFDRRILVNMATGRIVFKLAVLKVNELSGKISTRYIGANNE